MGPEGDLGVTARQPLTPKTSRHEVIAVAETLKRGILKGNEAVQFKPCPLYERVRGGSRPARPFS